MNPKMAAMLIENGNTDLLSRKDALLILTFDIKVMTTLFITPPSPNGIPVGPPMAITSVADLKCELDKPVDLVHEKESGGVALSFYDTTRKCSFWIPSDKFTSIGCVDKEILKRRKNDTMCI